MNHEYLMDALAIIAEEQQTCGAVELSIGGTNGGQVEHGTLCIINCPSSVIDALLDQGYTVSMAYGRANVTRL